MSSRFDNRKGIIVFSLIAVLAAAIGVAGGIFTKKYLRSDFTPWAGENVAARVGERLLFSDSLSDDQKSYGWIADGNYKAEVYGFDEALDKYVPMEGLAHVDESNSGINVVGIGVGMVRLSPTIDVAGDARADIHFESTFSNADTPAILEKSGYDFFKDHIALEEELATVKKLEYDSSASGVNFSDYRYFPNLRKVYINSASVLMPYEIDRMPSNVHIYVPTENYLSYTEAVLWSEKRESIFARPKDDSHHSVILMKQKGSFNENDDGASFIALEVENGKTLPLDSTYAVHRDGSRFIGWNDEIHFAEYNGNTPIYNDVKLYANWDLIQYKIRFHYGNASGSSKERVDTVTFEYGDPIYTLGKQTASYGNFELIGWSLSKDSRKPEYELEMPLPGSFVNHVIEEYDLYAFWVYKEANVIIVDNVQEQSIGTVPYNGSKALIYNTIPVGNGRFAGFSLINGSNSIDYRNGDVASDLYVRSTENTNDFYLYAVFSPDYFQVEYWVNGTLAYIDEDVADYNALALGRPGTKNFTNENLRRDGYRFVGWQDRETGILHTKEADFGQYPSDVELQYDENLVFTDFGGETLTKVVLDAYFLPNTFDVLFEKSEADVDESVFESFRARYDVTGELHGSLSKKGHTITHLFSDKKLDVLNEIEYDKNALSKQAIASLYQEIRETANVSDNDFQDVSRLITLTPEWSRDQYTVTFNMNGYGSSVIPPAPQEIDYGELVARPESPVVGNKYAGMTFAGWRLGQDYFDFESQIIDSSIELVALWFSNDLEVNFDLNYGGGYAELYVENADAFGTQIVRTNDHIPAVETPIATGYTFGGWYLNPNRAEEHRVDFETYSVTAPITLYAKWNANSYHVIYHGQGHGDLETDMFEDDVVYPGLVLQYLATKESEPDYSFAGWYRNPSCDDISQYELSTFVTEELELYAKWNREEHQIVINEYGAPAGAAMTLSGLHYGDQINEPSTPEAYGYTFVEYRDSLNNKIEFPYTMPNTDVTWRTIWSKNTYTVTFDYRIDSIGNQTRSVSYLDYVGVPTVPQMNGVTFVGWYMEPDFITQWDFSNNAVTQDTTLYAKWVVSVKIDYCYSYIPYDIMEFKVIYGSSAQQPSDPAEYGFNFKGWFTEKDGDNGFSFEQQILSDITVYAHWERLQYTVSFDFNGGWGNAPAQTVYYYGTVSKPADPQRTDYTFKGWIYDNRSWDFANDVVKGRMTLVASWEPDKTCLIYGTMIEMADGSLLPVESLQPGDLILALNHETGQYEATPVAFNENTAPAEHVVIRLCFNDGTEIGVVYSHGFFDLETMRYVYIGEENAMCFIGHRFAAIDGEKQLIEVRIQTEFIGACSPISFHNLNLVTNGLISMSAMLDPFINIFSYDENLCFDAEELATCVKLYGLTDYEEFADVFSYEVFCMFRMEYFAIMEAKGLVDRDTIIALYEFYLGVGGIE